MLLLSIIKSLNKFDMLNLGLSFISGIINIYFPVTNPIGIYFFNGTVLLLVIIFIGWEKIEKSGKKKNDEGYELKELISEKNYTKIDLILFINGRLEEYFAGLLELKNSNSEEKIALYNQSRTLMLNNIGLFNNN